MAHALEKGSIVAVIGCGAMGSGIAQVAAASGHQVRLYDSRPGIAGKVVADIAKVYGRLVEKGRMGAAEAGLAAERLRGVDTLTELADAAIVIEAIVEKLDVKRELFAELENIVGD